MVRHLIDTNIFLEILLNQEKAEACRKFLNLYDKDEMCISDFSLHSIGLILVRRKLFELYSDFIEDVLPLVEVVSLPITRFSEFALTFKDRLLDYDDFYQYWIAVEKELRLVTLDSDFKKVQKDIPVIFI